LGRIFMLYAFSYWSILRVFSSCSHVVSSILWA
jgi:hypothetical protein